MVIATFMVVSPSNVKASTGNILYVGGSGPGNYTKIQDAIDNASDGDTIFVYSGIYYENLIINKSITLIGENRETTIICGSVKENFTILIDNISYVEIKEFTIQNASGYEYGGKTIYIKNSTHIKIKYNILKRAPYLIYLENTSHSESSHNIISEGYTGIFLVNSNNNILSWNILKNVSNKIILSNSNFNRISNNNFSKIDIDPSPFILLIVDYPLALQHSNCNIIENNTFANGGIHLAESYENIIRNNTVCGKPIIYLYGIRKSTITSSAGQIILENCSDISIHNVNLTDIFSAVILIKSSNISIFNSTFTHNNYGILIFNSSYNIISNCSFQKNFNDILVANQSRYNIVEGNSFRGGSTGVIIGYASHNIIRDNYFKKANNMFFGGTSAIDLLSAHDNLIESNYVESATGCVILMKGSNRNKIIKNEFKDYTIGVQIKSGENNSIYYNNFYSYGLFVIRALDAGYNNTWDDGISKGNFWNGFEVKDRDGDGIIDPYKIPSSIYGGRYSQDRYPLAKPYGYPIADFIYVIKNNRVYFDATVSKDTDDGKIVEYRWDFGDGNISYEAKPMHFYRKSGTYLVILNVTDDDGRTATLKRYITVGRGVGIFPPLDRGIICTWGIPLTESTNLKIPIVIGRLCIEVWYGSDVKKVEFYLDGKLRLVDDEYPFNWTINKKSLGKIHTIKIKVYKEHGDIIINEYKVRIFNILGYSVIDKKFKIIPLSQLQPNT